MKAILSLFVFGAILSAAPITEQVTLTSVGTPLTDSHGNYVGPYTLSINGGSNIFALCVDDKDGSGINSSWTANVTQIASGDFSKTYSPTSSIEYKESAFLFNLITQANADRINIQHATWDIMDYGISSGSVLTNLIGNGTISGGDGAITYINQALSGYSSMNLSGFQVLTAVNSPRQQEFLVMDPGSAAPEPTTYALLGGGLLLVSCHRMLQRRKQQKAPKAAPAGLVRVSSIA